MPRSSPERSVFRFAVVAEDDRRSSTWRIWTDSSGRSTDDTYLAPRHSAGFKVSLHKDGYCQHGPGHMLRRTIRPEDRHALDRWYLPAASGGIRLGYFLVFPSDHHRCYPTPLKDATAIPASPAGGAVVVLVFILDSAEDLVRVSGGTVVRTLDRANGGLVAVVVTTQQDASPWTDDVDSLLERPAGAWTPPGYESGEPNAAWAFMERFGVRGVIEVSPDSALYDRPLAAFTNFAGKVLQRDDYPGVWPQHMDLCAVLVVEPSTVPSCRLTLYVDPAARCDLHHLVDDANRLAKSAERPQVGAGWDRLPDGSLHTGILCRRALERVGQGWDAVAIPGPSLLRSVVERVTSYFRRAGPPT